LLTLLPATGYSAWVLSAGTRTAPAALASANDKLLHVAGFGLATVLYAVGLSTFKLSTWTRTASCWALAVVLGGVLELCQARTRTRSAEWADWVADIVGATLAALGLLLLQRWVDAQRAAGQ
jgi:VanZ family protein